MDMISLDFLLDILNNLPTEDVEPVVRCDFCKNASPPVGMFTRYCNAHHRVVMNDWFCWMGEQ